MDLEAPSGFCISISGNCFSDPNKHQNTTTQQQQHHVASNGSAQLFNTSSDERLEGKWGTILLAYQTMGVVFGGLVTSPLYVYPSMTLHVPSEENYLGIYSLMFWTLTLISVVKYIFIALHADDHGEGGTFALYSLLCRHANIGQHPIRHLASDTRLSHFSQGSSNHSRLTKLFEKNISARRVILFISMLGTCMLIGDGILTPAISVLSAMQGLKNAVRSLGQSTVVALSAVTLVILFLIQRFGTSKVSFLFSPIMITWTVTTPIIGLYNIIIHYPSIFKAISPSYIVSFFSRNGKEGWWMLGGVVLCITGAEAMFADLGHFNRESIKLAFLSMIYPSLVITYAGQTAYLIKNPNDYADGFYKFLPHAVYWPMFVVSTLAAIVASQALISAAFSIIKQSVTSDYFPRVKLVHTSHYKEGQIYCPEINYILMVLCVAAVVGFQSGNEIGNAFGVVVIMVMLITTILLILVMLIIWNTNVILVALFAACFATIEGAYVSAVLIKIPEGGWLPFAVSIILAIIMFGWYHGRHKKFEYEMANKMSMESLDALLSRDIQRVSGLCFFYSNIVHDIPPVVGHYLKNVRSLHDVIVLATFRYLPVKTVLQKERFIVKALPITGCYRCIIQYGYNDSLNVQEEDFTNEIVDSLEKYIKFQDTEARELSNLSSQSPGTNFPSVEQSLTDLDNARAAGVVHVVGKSRLQIKKGMNWFDRILLETVYKFLHINCRSSIAAYNIPASSCVEIGMIYEV